MAPTTWAAAPPHRPPARQRHFAAEESDHAEDEEGTFTG